MIERDARFVIILLILCIEFKGSHLGSCGQSVSKIDNSSNSICKDTTIFEDNFDTSIEENWIIEQYMPAGPDYEFVVYKKDSVYVNNNGTLIIKQMYQIGQPELKMDFPGLSDGCTRNTDRECKSTKFILQNPVNSGRLVSKTSFQYGDIEVKAKLPVGDWVYPQLHLEGDNNQKIMIAYSRGNENLTGNDDIDIGGSLLFAGPVLSEEEPNRSSKLSSFRGQNPFSADFHVYRLKWTPDKLEYFIDNQLFGETNAESMKGSSLAEKKLKFVLGVGVGGVTDFPDHFKSGNVSKPWLNRDRQQLWTFHDSRNEWLNTWSNGNGFEIDYIRIKSV